MSENATPGRLSSLDAMKGIAIFGLVMIHFAFSQSSNSGGQSSLSPLFEFVYAGLFMFFIISGYFYRPTRTYFENLNRRVKQLAVAFVLCTVILSFIMFVYLMCTGYQLQWSDFFTKTGECLLGVAYLTPIDSALYCTSPFEIIQGYYFIEIMMVAFIIFYAIVDWAIKDVKHLIFTMLVLAGVTCFCVEVIGVRLFWRSETAPIAAGLMLVGAFAGKYGVAEYIETQWKTGRYWLIFAVALVIGILSVVFVPTGLLFNESHYGSYGGWSAFTFYILAISCGYVLMVLVAQILLRIPVLSNIFIYLGKHTLAVLVFHTFYGKLLMSPFYTFTTEHTNPCLPIGEGFVCAVFAIILSLLTSILLRSIYGYLTSKKEGPSAEPGAVTE